jgi:Type I restriction enzyme R protein N terminus (HSDR_N)
MAKFPKKFSDRVSSRLKHFQNIAAVQRQRDVSEADTVTVVKDILAEIFGYDKYSELTSEHQIKGTYCDLAIRLDGKVRFLVEVKSAGLDLKDNHVTQAVNYGANQGIEWVILTNAIDWRVYRVVFGQPVSHEEVTSFVFTAINANKEDDLEGIFIIAREGIATDAIADFHQRVLLLNRFTIAQIIKSEPIVGAIRREMRKIFPDLKVEADQIAQILENDVLKRDVIDGDKAKDAAVRVKKAQQKQARAAAKESSRPSGNKDISHSGGD